MSLLSKLAGVPKAPRIGRGGRPLRIAYGRIFHEACAHSPLVTEQGSFEQFHHVADGALADAASLTGSELKGFMPAAELSGFVAAARLAGDITTVPLASSLAVPSGPISAECFEWLIDSIVSRIRTAGELDGIYLALHGSMQVIGLDEAPEAVILRRVREALGEGPRIAVSYDLHANLTSGLIDPVDVLIGYRSNPHWDLAPTGFRAGNRLIRTLRGEIKPVHSWRKLPMVLGGGNTIDFLDPMRGVFKWMKRLERDPAVLSASLFMVHPYTSAEDLAWAAHVCTDDDMPKADTLVEGLADRAWGVRRAPLPPMRGIQEALDEVRDGSVFGPVTLVDVDDIVGAGAPGGNTRFVEELVRDGRGLKALVPVHDPALVASLWASPEQSRVDVVLRGTEGYSMPEVPLTATLAKKTTAEFGRVIRLDVGDFHIAVCDGPPLPIHPKFWRALDLDPRKADCIVQKNFFHYRIFYVATSFTHIPVVSAGATSFDRVRERDYRVPVYPSADPKGWRESDPVLRKGAPMSTRSPEAIHSPR